MNEQQQYQQKMVESFNWRYENGQDSWSADPGLRATAVKLSQLLQGSGNKVLDIGCGAGNPALVLLEAGQQITGLDIFAHQNWDELRQIWGDNIELIKADFNQWDCDRAQFEAVMDNGCLHHQHPSFYPAYLNKVNEVLKAGGYLVLNIYADMNEQAVEGKIEYTDHERICKYFTVAEIEGLLVDAGFKLLNQEHLYRQGLNEYYMLVVAKKVAEKVAE